MLFVMVFPNNKILKNGDIINIDITVILNGWHGDTSRMFFIGKKSIKSEKLVDVTYKSMWEGIKKLNQEILRRYRKCYSKIC